MGFPVIQLFMIAARQVSKPIADSVIRYGKDHPLFRNKVLIPIGRSLVHMGTRLRMKRLGLGESITNTQVSEAAALEQASDFVQQVVIFVYSCAVFTSYYLYTRLTTPESLKKEEYDKYVENNAKIMDELRLRIEELEKRLSNRSLSVTKTIDVKTSESEGKLQRVSSLPIDDAVRIVLQDGTEFVVMRSGTSVGIEESSAFSRRKVPLIWCKKELSHSLPMSGLYGLAERFVWAQFGRYTG